MRHCLSVVLVTTALLATGCSAVKEKRQAYRSSESIAPLQVPDSLSRPSSDEALMLPEFQQPRPAADAPPFDTRPPEATNLPVEIKPEVKE